MSSGRDWPLVVAPVKQLLGSVKPGVVAISVRTSAIW
jgi:hypothetical protein